MRWPWAWRRTLLELPDTPPGVGGADPPCLVHLVREVNGLRPFCEFLEALRAHPPGVDHELVLAMKGFASPAQAAPYLAVAADLAPTVVYFPDLGIDLGVYFAAAARLRRDRYCFVNSYSRPLVDGWLAKLDDALALPGVGQVGASGSWASMSSWVKSLIGLPSAYLGLFPERPIVRALSLEIQREAAARKGHTAPDAGGSGPEGRGSASEDSALAFDGRGSASGDFALAFDGRGSASEDFALALDVRGSASSNGHRSAVSVARLRLSSIPRIPRELAEFADFPAPHVRTNAFMISHAALRDLRLAPVLNKMDAEVVESGRESITAQLERNGLSTRVVDCEGSTYCPGAWDRSGTFWQGEQERLLVADNQTRCYAAGTFARRSLLATLAWGVSAAPSPPREPAESRLSAGAR
jgi:hypothetical protein